MLHNNSVAKQPMLNSITLLSLGQHPVSGRAKRAEQDAQAFEMAAKLSKTQGLYAGEESHLDTLRPYVGMQVGDVSLLSLAANIDPVSALAHYLDDKEVDLIFCGSRAESGESSGMLPYLLAECLDLPVVSQVCDIEQTDGGLCVTQALPRGARRQVMVATPCVIIVDSAAPPARQTAYGPSLRGTIQVIPGTGEIDEQAQDFTFEPARKKPKRMKKVKAKTAADRFKAATASQAKGGEVIHPKTPEEGAMAILKLLKEEGVVKV